MTADQWWRGSTVSEKMGEGVYLQQEGVLLVRDLQSRRAPYVHNGAAGNRQPGLR